MQRVECIGKIESVVWDEGELESYSKGVGEMYGG